MRLKSKSAMSIAKKALVVAGLPVTVYSEKPLTARSGPVAVMFFLHGRTGSAKAIEWIAEDTVKEIAKRQTENVGALDLLVVTFVSGRVERSAERDLQENSL